MQLEEPFKRDKNGLLYLSSKDVKTKDIILPRIMRPYKDNASFYGIEGIDNYIIKDSTMYPFFNNRARHLNLLKELTKKQELFDNIDFPVAYYLSYFILRGIVIPYYKDYRSLRYIINMFPFSELVNYYNCESDELDNLISLFIKILEIIIDMFAKGVNYTDANTSNFMLYKSDLKVIDFEPGFVFIDRKNNRDLRKVLKKFQDLVNKVLEKYGFTGVIFKSGDDFYSTEQNLHVLRKRLER